MQQSVGAYLTDQTRISKRFAALREAGELGIVAYITAGDPSMDATLEFVLALVEAGTDVIELGVPFSDPLADGPTIQRASERALKAGARFHGFSIWCEGFAPPAMFHYLFSATSTPSSKWDWKNLRPKRRLPASTAFSLLI